MNTLNTARSCARIEPDPPNSALHLGTVYFFCTIEDRDEFEATQHLGLSKATLPRAAVEPERRFGSADKMAARLGPSPASLHSPNASFLG